VFGLGRKANSQGGGSRVHAEDDLADHAPIEALPADHRAEAYGWLAAMLFEDERFGRPIFFPADGGFAGRVAPERAGRNTMPHNSPASLILLGEAATVACMAHGSAADLVVLGVSWWGAAFEVMTPTCLVRINR